jgi:hypothetical protein
MTKDPVLSFVWTSLGIVAWNTAFAWLQHLFEERPAEPLAPWQLRARSLMKPYQWVYQRLGTGTTIVGLIGSFAAFSVMFSVYGTAPFNYLSAWPAFVLITLIYLIRKMHIDPQPDLRSHGLRLAKQFALALGAAIILTHPSAGTGLLTFSAILMARGPVTVFRQVSNPFKRIGKRAA